MVGQGARRRRPAGRGRCRFPAAASAPGIPDRRSGRCTRPASGRSCVEHQPGEQHALVGTALGRHAARRSARSARSAACVDQVVGEHRAPANRCPCRRCWGPGRRRRRACGPGPRRTASRSRRRRGRTARPPRPAMNSSITTRAPAAPNRPPSMSSMAASASARSSAMTTPLPAARPSALITIGRG